MSKLQENLSIFDILEIPANAVETDENGNWVAPKDDDEQEDCGITNAASKSSRTSVAKNKRQSQTVPTKPKEPEEPEDYGCRRIVYYAGHQIPIEDSTLKLEQVRELLEREFPELSKERTSMEYKPPGEGEEVGKIFAYVTGGKKGAERVGLNSAVISDIRELKKLKNIHQYSEVFIPSRDGFVYRAKETPIGVFVAKTNVAPNLAEMHELFKLKVPKLPIVLLQQIVAFFKEYLKYDCEVMAQINWNFETNEYVVRIPKQTVTKVSVDYDRDDRLVQAAGIHSNEVEFIQIHSHNTMPAFFSDTDNRDEKATQFYGVIGRLNSYHHFTFRYGVSGQFVEVRGDQLFDGWDAVGTPSGWNVSYPSEWKEQVTVL